MKVIYENSEFSFVTDKNLRNLRIRAAGEVVGSYTRIRRYPYCMKIGRKYYMTQEPSLTYVCSLLELKEGRPIVLCLVNDQVYLTVTCNEQAVKVHLDRGITHEVYVERLKDVYMLKSNFLFLSNSADLIRAVGDGSVFDSKVWNSVVKKPSRIYWMAAGAAVSLVLLLAGYFAYSKYRQQKRIEEAPRPYTQVYSIFIKDKIDRHSSVFDVIEYLFAVPAGDGFLPAGFRYENGTLSVRELVPVYDVNGKMVTYAGVQVYEKYSTWTPAGGSPRRGSAVQYNPDVCRTVTTVPADYRVVERTVERIPQAKETENYMVEKVKLAFSGSDVFYLPELIRKSVRHCVFIEKISYEYDPIRVESGAGNVLFPTTVTPQSMNSPLKVEAVKYRPRG